MMTLHEAAALLAAGLVDADLSGHEELRFTGVSIDSRRVQPGDLFVALTGERVDGHDFLDQAQARGAVAALVEARAAGTFPQIRVDDTRKALAELARGWRRRFDLPLIAVTGSNGKTTTKEMIASILAAAYGEEDRLATVGNLNNEIGVPLTLLRLRSHHRAAVVELGMNHPGETARLANMALPTIALVCNAQREHMEFMDSVGAVAHEHALAILSLPANGVAVFPADDSHAPAWIDAAGDRRIVDFSVSSGAVPNIASVMAQPYLEVDASVVHLATSLGTTTIKLHVPGLHNVRNAAAATAAAVALDILLEFIHKGLEAFEPVKGRMKHVTIGSGLTLIDDSYNANPDSMRAAIEVLAHCARPTLLILGDMGEVGTSGAQFHAEIGTFASERGIDSLFGFGPAMLHATAAFGNGARHFDRVEDLIAASVEATTASSPDEASAAFLEHRSVLVKGSRFMQMERIVEALVGAHAEGRSEDA